MTSFTPGIPPVPPTGNSSAPSPYGAPAPQAAPPQAPGQQHPQGQAMPGQPMPGQSMPGHQPQGQPMPGQQPQGQPAPAAYGSSHGQTPQAGLPQGYPGAAPQPTPSATPEQLAAKYEAAPISWAKALRPTQLGLFALIALGVMILLQLIAPILLTFMLGGGGSIAAFSIVNGIRIGLVLLVAAAAAVLGGLAFHRSGRREAIALAAAVYGAVEVVLTLLSMLMNAVASVSSF